MSIEIIEAMMLFLDLTKLKILAICQIRYDNLLN